MRAVVIQALFEVVQLLEPLIAQRPSDAPLVLGGLQLALVLRGSLEGWASRH